MEIEKNAQEDLGNELRVVDFAGPWGEGGEAVGGVLEYTHILGGRTQILAGAVVLQPNDYVNLGTFPKWG